MDTQTFEIQLADKTYTIEPQENGTFRVLNEEDKIGVVYPEVDEFGTTWKTMDELETDFVSQIGELISEHSLS